MSESITLTLPNRLIEPLRRMATATHQPVESLVLTALEASLPSLEGLTPPLRDELSALETQDNNALWQIMLEHVPLHVQDELNQLLERHQQEELTTQEQQRLDSLQQHADRIMLRKAHAAAVLRFRGQRIPTLAELHQLAPLPA